MKSFVKIPLLLLIFGSLHFHIWGQGIKTFWLDKGGEGRPPCEASVAISRKNPKNMVIGAVLNNVYYTKNGGKTWKKQKLTSPFGVWGDPVVIAGERGNFYYFHLSDPTGKNWESEEILDRMVCQKSTNGGKTWSEGTFFGLNHPKDQDKEWAVFDRKSGNIYVTWTQFDKYNSPDPLHRSNILFSRSENSGKTWTTAMPLNEVSGTCLDDDATTEGAVPTVGPDGQLYVAWSVNDKIYFDRSLDGGVTWLEKDKVVADQVGGWEMHIPGINRCNGMPVVACDRSRGPYRNTVYVHWADLRNGESNADLWVAKSSDGGDSWSDPIRIHDDPIDDGRHQFLSWMALDETTGYLYVIYCDRRNYESEYTDIYLSYSTDGGESFKNIRLSEAPFLPNPEVFFGDYNHIDAHNGQICAVWTTMYEGHTALKAAVFKHSDLENLDAQNGNDNR